MPAAAPAGLPAPVIHQAVIPMAAFYLILMAALGAGLLLLRRHGGGAPSPIPGPRRGWPALIRHVLGTAAGGYLLLLAVVTGYYYAIARVGGHFLTSAVTGFALLIALALPVFAACSWLAWRARHRDGTAPRKPWRMPR
jgi:uncharacterized protein DUF6256